jgi:hypothetical protein
VSDPTDSYLVVSDFIKALLVVNKGTLGLKDVFYGDVAKVPGTPIACVEAGNKVRELNGAPRRVMTTMTTDIIVYHGAVTTTEVNQHANDAMAEAIETLIHQDPYFDGLVIDSIVRTIESSYLSRANTIYRASRLVVEYRQQVQLPYPNP